MSRKKRVRWKTSKNSRAAIIYARYSPQPKTGRPIDSCEIQINKCRARAESMGLEVIGVYQDKHFTGHSLDRPGFKDCMEHVMRLPGRVVIIAQDVNRITRADVSESLELMKKLEDNEVHVVTLDGIDTTMPQLGYMIFGFFALLGDWLRKQSAERTQSAMMWRQACGEIMGHNTPYGFMVDPTNPKRMVADPDEQVVVKMILARDADGKSVNQIYHELKDLGVKNRGGKRPVLRETIQSILDFEQVLIPARAAGVAVAA